MENYVKISEDALKLSLSHNLLILLDENVSQDEKTALTKLMNELLDNLSQNMEKPYEVAYYNFISKFVDNDDVEVRTAQKLVNLEKEGKVDGVSDLIAMNIDAFESLSQENQFQTLFKFLFNMGIEIEKAYQELDMLDTPT